MKNKLLVILGPTSTGKTDLALEFAKKLGGEIISADSRQVYKYLNIGTGKLPGGDVELKKQEKFWEMDGINVNLYDVVEPKAEFNLFEYIEEVQNVLTKILKSERLPIIAGGTGLYIRSLLEGVSDFGTEENFDLRKQLEDLAAEEIAKKILSLNPAIHKKLNGSDIKNKRRLIRVFEKLNNPDNNSKKFDGIKGDFDVLKIGLTADIKILRERIKQRLVKRMKSGMIEESEKLLANRVLSFERMEQLGLEYRYIAKYLKGEIKNEAELIEILSTKIGQYAKRQMTWFRKEKDVVWFDITDPNYTKKLDSKILNWYNTR